MAILQQQTWKTADGRYFEDEEAAKTHEEALEEKSILRKRVEILESFFPKVHRNVLQKFAFHMPEIWTAVEKAGVDP